MTNDNCAPFVFDPWGNVHSEYNQYTYDNEKKDYQWLGATMDSNGNDNDKFVVSETGSTMVFVLFLDFMMILVLQFFFFLIFVFRFVHHASYQM